ncbi:MAG TPA: aspartate-semialdehyde dehydrogenase [Chthonomonas sp.]|uniref:aspartate-semialdehyde dehydrogenase n=1 Tax=Chthonomonas sp. TaxID=2282153 RepID=UPI002B4B6438|nr:aspartate-semialdehyde dehydrogenase [Chthonomonas sp.]HLI48188.1 aspartate-semialdehyde dehydrogenase [Chthonomonas sp.]
MKTYHVAIVGATGAVGTELLRLLEVREFPVASLRLLASERSAGRTLPFRGQSLVVERLDANAFENVDIAFFSAGASRSREFAPLAVRAGALVIDNSSAFRMDPAVPLVVPEINPEDICLHKGIIANPNCSTIIMLMALAPLRKLAPIHRVVVSTYQAASGAGAQAMAELIEQTGDVLREKPIVPRVFPYPIAFNLFCHNTKIDETGYNEEERKMIFESRKILHDPHLKVTATCVRVPVVRAHSESINVEFAPGTRPSLEEARKALETFPGVALVDNREANHFPMPIEASGRDEVLVGRLRYDLSNENAIDLFVSGDQILKGAALNAIQIAERWIKEGSKHA